MDSVFDHQRALPHGRAGSRVCGLRIGLTDVGKPAGAHGRTKLIAQVINGFGNSSPFVLLHVIGNSKILTHLTIIRIINISVISVISAIHDIKVIKCLNEITDIKVIKSIRSITLMARVSVLNPICRNMSSIK